MDNDFMNNLSNMIKNSNIPNDVQNSINPDMLKNIMNMFNNNSSNNSDVSDSSDNFNNGSGGASNIDFNTLLKIKSVMEKMNENKNDPRSNLLRSLKPYLKKSRQDKVEQYVQLFSVGKIINAFNQDGGENVK